jgi:hypothetical protein
LEPTGWCQLNEDLQNMLPDRVQVELQTTVRALKKRSRGCVIDWRGLASWNASVEFPDAGLQDVPWEKMRVIDARMLENPLFNGMFVSGQPGLIRRLDNNMKDLGQLLDGLQFLSLDWEQQESLIPGLAANPAAIQQLVRNNRLMRIQSRDRIIGPETLPKAQRIAQLLEGTTDPEREEAYEKALKEAGLDLTVIGLSCIRVSSAESGWEEEKLLPELDTKSLLDKIDQDRIAAIEQEFADLLEPSNWTVEELRDSQRMADITALAKECLQLFGVAPLIPELGWLTVNEEFTGCSGAFSTSYPELMLRLVRTV